MISIPDFITVQLCVEDSDKCALRVRGVCAGTVSLKSYVSLPLHVLSQGWCCTE
jgi:hypothetical protein